MVRADVGDNVLPLQPLRSERLQRRRGRGAARRRLPVVARLPGVYDNRCDGQTMTGPRQPSAAPLDPRRFRRAFEQWPRERLVRLLSTTSVPSSASTISSPPSSAPTELCGDYLASGFYDEDLNGHYEYVAMTSDGRPIYTSTAAARPASTTRAAATAELAPWSSGWFVDSAFPSLLAWSPTPTASAAPTMPTAAPTTPTCRSYDGATPACESTRTTGTATLTFLVNTTRTWTPRCDRSDRGELRARLGRLRNRCDEQTIQTTAKSKKTTGFGDVRLGLRLSDASGPRDEMCIVTPSTRTQSLRGSDATTRPTSGVFCKDSEGLSRLLRAWCGEMGFDLAWPRMEGV